MRRRDLEKLRRLDPKLAQQLERALEAKEAAQSGEAAAPPPSEGQETRTQARGPEGSCERRGAPRPAPSPAGTWTRAPEPPARPEASEEQASPPRAAAAAPEVESACQERPARHSPALFVDMSAQVGLPEVPQTLVSTEASPAERLAELWAGYPDEEVPGAEVERRKAEAKAQREAERARDAAHSAQLGFFPSAWWRRRGTGKHVRCEQLELQLDGIERRRGRHSIWDEGRSASRTMEHVEAQCFTVRELGDRAASIPEFLRGRHPTLTRTQQDILRAVITAYMGGAMGLYEYEAILASDLGMSERAFRYALNGGKDRPPGLVALGLVARRQTWKRGSGEGRPSDHHYLLLQVGPALGEELLPWACTQQARLGRRVPRRAGYTRRSAARRAVELRQEARSQRKQTAERRVRAKQLEAEVRPTRQAGSKTEPSRARRERTRNAKLNCAAQNAVNPVPPPSGDGGLGRSRGEPLQNPLLNDSLRERVLAPPKAPLPETRSGDSQPTEQRACGRARALDEVAKRRPTPDLDYWRRKQAQGLPIPDSMHEALLHARLAELKAALWG